jgi:hypothetical protein
MGVEKRVLYVVIAASFLLVGHLFVLQRSLNGPTNYLRIRGDTNHYVSMISGNITGQEGHFKHRLLVPLLARSLPYSPTESLRVISYVSLFFCYLFILLTCAEMKLPPAAAITGVFSVFASTGHLYNYHNPYLTDAFSLMCISLMMYALVRNSFILFCCTAVIAVLAREQLLIMLPAALFVWRDLRRTAVLIASVLLALIIPRYLLPTDVVTRQLLSAVLAGISLRGLANLGSSVIDTWGITWLIALPGLFYLFRERFYAVVISSTLLLSTALLTSFVATDTIRMFSVLAPLFGVSAAFFVAQAARFERRFLLVCWTLLLIQGLTAIPNRFTGEVNSIFMTILSLKIVSILLAAIYVALTLVMFRKPLLQAIDSERSPFAFDHKRYSRSNT